MPINSHARRRWHMVRFMLHAIFFEPIYHQIADFAKSVKRIVQDVNYGKRRKDWKGRAVKIV